MLQKYSNNHFPIKINNKNKIEDKKKGKIEEIDHLKLMQLEWTQEHILRSPQMVKE